VTFYPKFKLATSWNNAVV